MRRTLCLALAAFLPLLAGSAAAADLQLFGGGHFQGSGAPLAAAFSKKTAVATVYTGGNTGGAALPKRLDAGEPIDVIVMTRDDMDNQVKAGVIKADSVVSFARDRLGVAVLKGAPKPDVSTAAKFRAALLGAKAVGMQEPDPAHIHAGVTTREVLTKLGVYDEVKRKSVAITDPASALVAGKVDFNLWIVPEVLQQPKLELAGRVPAELGGFITLAAGVPVRNRDDAKARAFIRFLSGADGRAVWTTTGLEPL